MNHQDAIRESSVEQYILGELKGNTREQFEQHLFDCRLCTADLKAGVLFLDVSRSELPALMRARSEKKSWFAWLLAPSLLVPALAASLLVSVYETAVVIPAKNHELALANAPGIVDTVTLAAGTSRGDEVRQVHARPGDLFVVFFDIPAQSSYLSYVCSLYSPQGTLVWQGEVTAEQARDTVKIRVPVAATQAGTNRLVVQGRSSTGSSSLAELSQYEFSLRIDTKE